MTRPGVDAERGAVQAVLHVHAGHAAVGEAQAGDLVVDDDRAGPDGRAHGHDGHARVVHLVVAVDRDSIEAVGAQAGVVGRGPGGGYESPDAVAEGRQHRVREDARTELGRAVRAALVDRQVEGERVDQVGATSLAGTRRSWWFSATSLTAPVCR